jgi:hypothetical protein
MKERDYSHYINNPSSKQDDRPFWLRLLLSIKPSFSFSAKKIPSSVSDVSKGIKFNIKGGADF